MHPLFFRSACASVALLWLAATASAAPGPRAADKFPAPKVQCKASTGHALVSGFRGVVFIGEHHGTEEIPEHVARLACMALASGRTVHLALELPVDWHGPLQAFLHARGNEQAALNRFMRAVNWSKLVQQYPDGRTSVAMAGLLKQMRQLALAGLPLSASTFDTRPWESPLNSDVGMAAALTRNIEAAGADLSLVLSGEFHTRPHSDPAAVVAQPMAYLVTGARPAWAVMSVLATYSDGAIWGCGPDNQCGPMPQRTGLPLAAPALQALPQKHPDGYSAALYVGKITASPPFLKAAP